MQFFYEIFPVFLFFIVFKLYDIYAATMVGVLTTAIQVALFRCVKGYWDKKQLITLAVFIVFGGLTLYFHNPIFVKWKPTIVFWLFSLAIIFTQLFTDKPLMRRLMENMLHEKGHVPAIIWSRLNFIWAIFFIILGSINLYVAYYYSNDVWVNFKFYGVTSALFLLSVFQALYLMRYMEEKKQEINK